MGPRMRIAISTWIVAFTAAAAGGALGVAGCSSSSSGGGGGGAPSDGGGTADEGTDAAVGPATQASGGEGYQGKPFTSGAHVYRILYRTERGDAANSAGYSSAIVYVPDTPRTGPAPVVVASHGSRGQAAKCAPSKGDPAGDY